MADWFPAGVGLFDEARSIIEKHFKARELHEL